MNIENAYVKADEHLRNNLKQVKSALKGAKDKDRQLILATGAMSIIYASEIYSMTIDESIKSVGNATHPAVVVRERFNAYLDRIVADYEAYLKSQQH